MDGTLTFWIADYGPDHLSVILNYAISNGLQLTETRAEHDDAGMGDKLWLTFHGELPALERLQDFVKKLSRGHEETSAP